MLCVEDHFQTSKPAFEWALKHMVDEDDDVHIVTVLPPVAYSVTPGEAVTPHPSPFFVLILRRPT